MDNLNIIQLPPDRWKDYKNLRLKALKENPESFGETYVGLSLRTDKEWKTLLSKSLDGLKRWVFFAELDGRLIGMVSGTEMTSIPNGAKVREMFVSAEERGKGVATKLMSALEKELLESTDKRVLRLGVFKTQTDAVDLYKSLGFEVIEEKTEHFPNGLSHESLIMEKKL